jgi:NTP pyrophosphatase (non-canonical NTP hydrolase)
MEREIIDEVLEFRNERDWEKFHTPDNLAKSLSIESSELLECFQWSSEYDKQEASEELADILIYAILMAESMGVDINQIIKDKLVKNGKKYPVEKSKGNSTKYNKF